jgi:hypothetical protein
LRSSGTSRIPSRLALIAAAGLLAGAAHETSTPMTGHAGSISIPLSVYEDAGVARAGGPVRIGVPLPASAAIRDANELRVRAADGSEVPVQARVLTRWVAPPSDASAPARWVLLDLDATVAAKGPADITHSL